MPRIAVILPYAVSIRDFVHTGALAELLKIEGSTVQIYTQNPALPEFDAIRSDRVTLAEMEKHHDGWLEATIKRLYPLTFHDRFVNVQQSMRRSWRKRMLAHALVGLRKLLGTRRMLALYGFLLSRLSALPSGKHQISGEPDLVISTRSLINSLDYPLLLEAARRRLPQLAVASSWDNFTTKGFFPFPVARTIVWNQQMANELQDIFKVDPSQIVKAGYPRVRLLQRSGRFTDATQYLESLGLQHYRRFVLYSASYGELTRIDPARAPMEFELIREVALELEKTLPSDTCIIVRLHPFSRAIDESFFEGIPRMQLFVPGRRDRYVERVMSADDEMHLSAQIKFSECIISMASTMSIDALSLGKPVLNVAFEPEAAGKDSRVIRRFYAYNHFRDLIAAVKLPMAANVDDVIAFVQRCLSGDKAPKTDSAAFERLYVPSNSQDYPHVVRATAEDVLRRNRSLSRSGR